MSINEATQRRFYGRSLVLYYCAGIAGFLLGVKLCDALLFRPERFELMRENLED